MPSAADALKDIPAPKKSASAALGSAGENPQKWAQAAIKGDDIGGELYHAALPVVGTELDYWGARALKGKEYADALVNAEQEQHRRFEKEHPYIATGLQFAGSMLTPGVGKAGRVIGGLESGAARLAGTIGLGTAMGAAQGAEEAGRGHRVAGAIPGAIGGAVTTGMLGTAGKLAGAAGRGVDALSGHKISSALSSAGQRARAALGRTARDSGTGAEQAAARRLGEAAKHEKFAEHAPTRQEKRIASGVGPGTVQEVAAPKGPLARTAKVAARKMGAAVEKGKAEEEPATALSYAEGKAEGLPSRAVELVGRIHDYPSTSDMRIAHRVAMQRSQAATKYREPWAQPVKVEGPVLEAVSNPEARSAITMARRTAALHGDTEQVEGIQKLERYSDDLAKYQTKLAEWEKGGGIDLSALPADARDLLARAETPQAKQRLMQAFGIDTAAPSPPPPPEIPAGALDRIRIAIRNKADSLMDEPGGAKKATHGLGAGLMKLSTAIDEGLGNIEGLKEARAAFKAHQDVLDALHAPGKLVDIMNVKPQDFERLLKSLPEGGIEDVKIAVRDLLAGRVQGDTGPAIGLLRKISRGDYAKQNLKTLVGDELAEQISTSADILRKDLEQARFIAGTGESNTAANLEDQQAVSGLVKMFHSPANVAHWLMDHIVRAGYAMTPEEASAILKFAQGSPEHLMQFLADHPQSSIGRAIETAKPLLMASAGARVGSQLAKTGAPQEDTPSPSVSDDDGLTGSVSYTGDLSQAGADQAYAEAYRQQMQEQGGGQ